MVITKPPVTRTTGRTFASSLGSWPDRPAAVDRMMTTCRRTAVAGEGLACAEDAEGIVAHRGCGNDCAVAAECRSTADFWQRRRERKARELCKQFVHIK
jgi:hypothetical protein